MKHGYCDTAAMRNTHLVPNGVYSEVLAEARLPYTLNFWPEDDK